MLTEVQSGLDGRAGSMATLTDCGTKAVLADGVLRWSSGLQDCTSRCVASLRSRSRVQGGPTINIDEQSLGNQFTSGGGFRRKSGACRG